MKYIANLKAPKELRGYRERKKRANNHHSVLSCNPITVVQERENEHMIRTLSYKISKKRKIEYSQDINWFRTKTSTVLVKGAIICIRGSRDWRTSVYTD